MDCSVAISWYLVDENDDYANAILAMMPDCEAYVPGIWSLEIANTLLVAERRNRMTAEQSELAIDLLQSLLIYVDEDDGRSFACKRAAKEWEIRLNLLYKYQTSLCHELSQHNYNRAR